MKQHRLDLPSISLCVALLLTCFFYTKTAKDSSGNFTKGAGGDGHPAVSPSSARIGDRRGFTEASRTSSPQINRIDGGTVAVVADTDRSSSVSDYASNNTESNLRDEFPLPLSALGLNPDLKLTGEQLQIMGSLGAEFLAATKSADSSGRRDDSEAEREVERWQAAQSINDEQFRNLFGDEVFNAQQVYRAQIEQAAEEAHTGSKGS